MITVAQWMTRELTTVAETTPVIEAMHLMKERNIRRLPVLRDGRLAGLITEKMIKEFAPSKATSLDTWEVHYILGKTTVREVMNKQPITIPSTTGLCEAAQLLCDHKLYGLCVVDNDALVGILTTTNLLQALIAICPLQDR